VFRALLSGERARAGEVVQAEFGAEELAVAV